MKKIEVEVSIGELLDKITILEIKQERIKQEDKLKNIQKELSQLLRVKNESLNFNDEIDELYQSLKSTNEALWEIEDEIRNCERVKDFGPQFIQLARKVYNQNDIRCMIKRELNEKLGSELKEEKSYSNYSH